VLCCWKEQYGILAVIHLVVQSKEAVGHLFCVPWILCSTVPTANTAQGSGTLVQAVNVYGIFGAFVIVLSNERDCPCIRRVALNAVTENLQMAGKQSVTEY
jgi:hypothetical protein